MVAANQASNVLGWMSIACWMIVATPQLYENYTLQSGEGLSVLFLVIWLLGDLTSAVGALMAGLLPTISVLSEYYLLCDLILLGQVYYYRRKRQRRRRASVERPEMAPLIARPENEAALNEKAPVLTSFFGRRWVQYALSVLFVLATGFIAAVASSGTSDDGGGGNDEVLEWKSQTLGWISASLYIGSRIPQIIKNAQTKCAGLSLALFVFAVGGNLTFVLSILVASTSMKHLIANASWLAGSGLTIFLDFIVFWQFFHYRSENITNDDDEETA